MHKLSPIPVGCAFLNQRNNINSGGWASLAGAEPFKFTTLESLRVAGPLWVLSTPENAFLAEGGAALGYLRHAGFVSTPVTAIAEEVVPHAANNAAVSAQRVAEILTRVLAMAEQLAPVSAALSGDSPAARTLTAAVQALMAPSLRSDPMPAELLEAMPSLFKAPPPLSSPNGNDIAVRVPANRILLAESVLNSGVPGCTWSEVPLGEYPNPLSWAIGDNKPVIAKVSVRGPLPRVKANAPLMGHLTRGAVRWMALPEIIALSRIVEMRAERVFVADEMVPPGASLKIPPPAFAPAALASISAGLFAETYLMAASTPSLAGAETQDGEPRSAQTHSVRAAWLTAAARALLMQEAMALSMAGFSVIGYGATHVLVSVSRRNLRNFRRAVGASKLLSYPTGLRAMEPRSVAPSESHELNLRGEHY